MSPTAVAAPFPDNEGDDVESQIVREVLTHGRGMLAEGLVNLLIKRQTIELGNWLRFLDYMEFRRSAFFRPKTDDWIGWDPNYTGN